MDRATFSADIHAAANFSACDELNAVVSTGDEQFRASFAEETLDARLSEAGGMLSAGFGTITIVTPQSNYEALFNKPAINSVTLVGDQTGDALGLVDTTDTLSTEEIDDIISTSNAI